MFRIYPMRFFARVKDINFLILTHPNKNNYVYVVLIMTANIKDHFIRILCPIILDYKDPNRLISIETRSYNCLRIEKNFMFRGFEVFILSLHKKKILSNVSVTFVVRIFELENLD